MLYWTAMYLDGGAVSRILASGCVSAIPVHCYLGVL
jgi:hypothetical protein